MLQPGTVEEIIHMDILFVAKPDPILGYHRRRSGRQGLLAWQYCCPSECSLHHGFSPLGAGHPQSAGHAETAEDDAGADARPVHICVQSSHAVPQKLQAHLSSHMFIWGPNHVKCLQLIKRKKGREERREALCSSCPQESHVALLTGSVARRAEEASLAQAEAERGTRDRRGALAACPVCSACTHSGDCIF